MNIINDIANAFLPETILIIFIIINIILSVIKIKNSYKSAKILNITALLISFILMAFIQIKPDYYAFNNVFVSNIYTLAFKIMIIMSAVLIIFSSSNMIREKRQSSFEYFAIFLSGILGSFLLISANDFISAFIALETLSLSCYLLSGFRKNHKGKESSLKYLITSSCASAIMLFGVSYLYGITGSLNFTVLNDTLVNEQNSLLLTISSIIILSGLMFKFACIPFSNWIIDVYEGSTYPVCLYISLIPKLAAAAIISRLFVFIFQFNTILQITISIIALITIFYASLGAIKQTNIKRLYAYSSIIHSGFILLTISISNAYAIASVLFYLFSYIFMNIGIWTASSIFNNLYNTDDITDYKGLFYKHPYFSSALITCLFALAGLPPTSGFIAKLYIYTAIARAGMFYILILLFVLTATVFALYLYLKVIKVLFEKQTSNINFNTKFTFRKVILYICSIITFLICLYPDTFIKLSQICAYYII